MIMCIQILAYNLRATSSGQERKNIFSANAKRLLNPFKIKNVFLASIIAFSFMFVLCTYNVSMENSLIISKSVNYYNEIVPLFGTIMMGTNLLVMAPIAEEIALRGIVLVIGATLMALVFGYIFYKFKSLWVCIIAHTVANFPVAY